MESEKLKDLIFSSFKEAKKSSFKEAKKAQDSDLTPQDLHKKRSQEWVKVLAQNFRKYYSNKDDAVSVFSKDFGEHRTEFKVNELLYDIAVCRVGKTPSAQKGTPLTYIQEALWVVESEMVKDSHEAIIDFSKLVMGSARNKLFIGPKVNNQGNFNKVLLAPAGHCCGSVYLAIIPHPEDWDKRDDEPEVFIFSGGSWKKVS